MKIALIGYGKMGKEIEKIAIERGHEISLVIDKNNLNDLDKEDIFYAIDVVIEFTNPTVAVQNYKKCFDLQKAVVSGTTGWIEKMDEVKNYCKKQNAAFFYASNFSLGVNLFFQMNKYLARLMSNFNQYNARINEIHHTEKLDAPSGTAITLAEGIIETDKRFTTWKNIQDTLPHELSINSQRVGKVSGTHQVIYQSENDTISLIHEAHNRKGFALGAVLAAEFVQGKKGIFGMSDLLQF